MSKYDVSKNNSDDWLFHKICHMLSVDERNRRTPFFVNIDTKQYLVEGGNSGNDKITTDILTDWMSSIKKPFVEKTYQRYIEKEEIEMKRDLKEILMIRKKFLCSLSLIGG